MNPTANCLFCDHCYMDTGESRYSEYTPGSDWSISCSKNVFSEQDGPDLTQKAFGELLMKAVTCEHYKDPEEGEVTR